MCPICQHPVPAVHATPRKQQALAHASLVFAPLQPLILCAAPQAEAALDVARALPVISAGQRTHQLDLGRSKVLQSLHSQQSLEGQSQGGSWASGHLL